ncbi:MAG: DsbA family protein [Desulfobacula sp.]|nr:DsbA family protein [Desulfobacula sp.]
MTGRIEKLEKEYDIRIKWRAFPLHPDTPEKGRTLEELFKKKGVSVNVDKMMKQLKATAAKFGLALGDRKMTYNSRLAQEVGLWAQTKGHGHKFHIQVFKAYFVQGLNIAQKEVLLNLIEQSGLDPREGKMVIETREFSNAVDSDWELSKQKGVTAVPSFFMGIDRLVGAQPYESLERLIDKYIEKVF